MKKLGFILALGTIFVSSCKKDYTCTCTYVTGGAAGKEVIPNVSQQQAATICAANEVYDPTNGGTQTIKCSL